MVEKPGKYAAALATIRSPDAAKSMNVQLPTKEQVFYGKRSRPEWRQKAVLLQTDTADQALERLKRRGDRTDFSDLMQALLEAWLDSQ